MSFCHRLAAVTSGIAASGASVSAVLLPGTGTEQVQTEFSISQHGN